MAKTTEILVKHAGVTVGHAKTVNVSETRAMVRYRDVYNNKYINSESPTTVEGNCEGIHLDKSCVNDIFTKGFDKFGQCIPFDLEIHDTLDSGDEVVTTIQNIWLTGPAGTQYTTEDLVILQHVRWEAESIASPLQARVS